MIVEAPVLIEFTTEQQLVQLSKALYPIASRSEDNEYIATKYCISHFYDRNISMDTVYVEDSRGHTILFYNNMCPGNGVTWNGTKEIFYELWQEVANIDDYVRGVHAVKI